MDLQGLWILVEEKHMYSASEIGVVVKLEVSMQLQNLWQGAYETIISYKQC